MLDQLKDAKLTPGMMIKNQCCQGFDWEICVIIESVWGRCFNPDCPQVCGCGEPCYYDGVSSISQEKSKVKYTNKCPKRERGEREA